MADLQTPELSKETRDQLWAVKRHIQGAVKAIEKLLGKEPDAEAPETKER